LIFEEGHSNLRELVSKGGERSMAVRAGDFGRSPVLRAIGWSLSVAGILLIGWQFISTEAMGIVVDGGWALPRAVLGAAVGYAMALTLLALPGRWRWKCRSA
jgi:uncharacterized RDD family membrane protein YckC